MPNKFVRAYLLLIYGGNEYAFQVLVRQYAGGRKDYPKQITRNPDGDLLIVRAPENKRRFMGRVVLDHDASGTIVYESETYTFGTDVHLQACMEATNLSAKSFEDTAFWSAENMSPWDPKVEADPVGNIRYQDLILVEK